MDTSTHRYDSWPFFIYWVPKYNLDYFSISAKSLKNRLFQIKWAPVIKKKDLLFEQKYLKPNNNKHS